jgi:hypothetical protein
MASRYPNRRGCRSKHAWRVCSPERQKAGPANLVRPLKQRGKWSRLRCDFHFRLNLRFRVVLLRGTCQTALAVILADVRAEIDDLNLNCRT